MKYRQKERKSQMFYNPMNVHSVACAIGNSISITNLWSILNQVGNRDFYSGQKVDNLRGRKLFSDQINR